MDYDLWIKLALRYQVQYLPAVLAHARIYPTTKTARGGLKRLDEIEQMIRRYGRSHLPMFFYPEMVRACWAAGWQAVADRDWRQWASATRRGMLYGGVLLLREAGVRT